MIAYKYSMDHVTSSICQGTSIRKQPVIEFFIPSKNIVFNTYYGLHVFQAWKPRRDDYEEVEINERHVQTLGR